MQHNSILILSTGKLGLPVIRHFAQHAKKAGNTTVTVLLRPATIAS